MLQTEKIILESFDIPLYIFFRKIYPTDASTRLVCGAKLVTINGQKVSIDDLKNKTLENFNNTSIDVLHLKIGKKLEYNIFLE